MYISYWPKAFSIAKMLRDEIELKTGIRHTMSNAHPSIINYGNSNVQSTANSPEFIKLCVNKIAFSNLMRTHGIASPQFFTGIPTSFPCLVREQIGGFSGHGIHAVHNLSEYNSLHLSPRFHWTPFLKCLKEYRIHVLGGTFVKVFEKVPVNPEPDLPIRNSYNDYHYTVRDGFPAWRSMMALQEQLRPVLTGAFYALDAGWDNVRKCYVVFEGGSAPGLNSLTVGLYADYLINTLHLPVKNGGNDGVLRPNQTTQRSSRAGE